MGVLISPLGDEGGDMLPTSFSFPLREDVIVTQQRQNYAPLDDDDEAM